MRRRPEHHPAMTTLPLLPARQRANANKALRAWQRAAGPWSAFVWPTLLTVPRPNQSHPAPWAEPLAASWIAEFRSAVAGSDAAAVAWRSGKALAFGDLPAIVALASAP